MGLVVVGQFDDEVIAVVDVGAASVWEVPHGDVEIANAFAEVIWLIAG